MSEVRHRESEFKPWLLQVLETHLHFPGETPRALRCTVEEARKAWDNKEEPLQHGDNLPRKVAQYIDDRTSWHYMGNAEYEFGSIPSAINHLFSEELVTAEFNIPKEKLPKNHSRGNPYYHDDAKLLSQEMSKTTEFRDEELVKKLKEQVDGGPESDMLLYYLGPKRFLPEIPALLNLLTKDKLRTKAGTRFKDMADPIGGFDKKYHGWLCLDFPFWMTKNKEFFEHLVALYIGKEA